VTCACRSRFFSSLSETRNALVVIPGLKPLVPEDLHTEMFCLQVSWSQSALECAEISKLVLLFV